MLDLLLLLRRSIYLNEKKIDYLKKINYKSFKVSYFRLFKFNILF